MMMNAARIQHLIVLMLENRAFDHLVGYLTYPAGTDFEGINGRRLFRPRPAAAGAGVRRAAGPPDPRLGRPVLHYLHAARVSR